MDASERAETYRAAVVDILRARDTMWCSHEHLACLIGLETAPHYIWLHYYLDGSDEFVRRTQPNGRCIYALRSRYTKETPWWKRVLDILSNRIE